MLRREGPDPIVSEKLYRVVFQVVLLFGEETWVLTASMLQKLEEVHVGFLRQVTGMTARNLGVGTCQKEGAEIVLQETDKKPLQEYINMSQATVAEWVSLQPIFDFFAK